jgi:putative DNA primase/helicase
VSGRSSFDGQVGSTVSERHISRLPWLIGIVGSCEEIRLTPFSNLVGPRVPLLRWTQVTPEFKLMISGNHKPEIRGSDDGIWRRVALVPWGEQIAAEDVDKGLPDKLWAEAPGILAWLVRGCLKYLESGLEVPEAVRKATDEYRQESDKLRLFLQTECRITGAPDDFERARDLVDAFNAWLLDRGDAVWGKRQISLQLKDREAVVHGPAGQRFGWKKRNDSGYGGIILTDTARNRIAEYGEELRQGQARKG